MSFEKWELSHHPTEREKNRWRLKLRIDEQELTPVLNGIPGSAGRPFLLENDEFSFALYIYEGNEQNLQQLKEFLESLCPDGKILAPPNEEPLDSLLGKVVESLGGIAEAKPRKESDSPAEKSVPSAAAPPPAPDPAPAQPPAPDRDPVPAPGIPKGAPAIRIEDLPLNPGYTFQEFIIGPNNRFTAAAAQAVADNPGKIYNPFFIYGGVGLGKTHLMHAVGHYIKNKNNGMRISFVTTEKFMTEVIDSIRRGALQEMREHYRQVDLLLVDDIQFLVESESTQEEFFHIFNILHQNGKQIIITSDRPPKQLTTLEDRLRSRFEWGLIADIKSPNLETRVAILKKKEELEHLKLDENILLFIASKLKSNIRELEGFLKRINAYASLTHQEANMELVRTLMLDLLPEEGQEEPAKPQDARPPSPAPMPPPELPKPVPPLMPPEVPLPRPVAPPIAPLPPIAAPKFTPAAAPSAASEGGDSNLKPVEAGFFFPEGKEADLARVKERFLEVIKKHKLKFRLESVFDHAYNCAGKINHAFFAEFCKNNNVVIAVVLGPPPDATASAEDFGNLLATVMDDENISLQMVPWAELNKDYRYLNLALDITLLKHHR